MNKEKIIACSFCDSSQDKLDFLVEGNNAYICNMCIQKADKALKSNNKKISDFNINNLITPPKIKSKLDSFIVGQDVAKKTLSVAVYNHYKRILNNKSSGINIDKSNVLLIGPTGTGKTLLAKTLANILKIPFVIVDATVLTEAGYVGEDVENILVRLFHESGYDIEKTQKGIIYIDEIDKIARKNSNPSITRDVSGEGVQQSLLKIIEGTVASIPPQGGRKHPEQPLIKINTSEILFICGGTFDGIGEIIGRRVKGGGIGFDRNINPNFSDKNNLSLVKVDDIIKYGFIPELTGRLPIITYLDYLDQQTLLKILVEPTNSLTKQYIELFKYDKIELIFEKDALNEISRLALERKTGARALRSVIDEVMIDIMYDIPNKKNVKKCIISKDVVTQNVFPELVFYKKIA
ncbi:MAG: ATP-dependent Clp protease ATP-binding subunit ClpX [Candidatus Marinimicrobia bacterium]|nr:ATP-dependent Clp protease ATP-binding subunit ClpX [Candidatus Neomarinimicrobiota bacterium]|tara:strand:+ start:16504 stop:17724 length:1221 start_codon:yes stop_codon:yes gene_type:complete